MELLAGRGVGIRKNTILIVWKGRISIYRSPSIRTADKTKLTQQTIPRKINAMVDRLAHFHIAIHHIAGNKLKFTDYLSLNPVEGSQAGRQLR